jgi:formylmethanofuran dehydrogenase subunit B
MPESLNDAVERGAGLLAAARFPVIAGLGTDIAGVVAALKLAEKIGAAVDHDASESALRLADVLRTTGLMFVTPAEARASADTFLLVGDRPMAIWPEIETYVLGAPSSGSAPGARPRILSIGGEDSPARFAALRARVNGRPISEAVSLDEADALARMLRSAKYGVAVFAPEELDTLAIEMLAGLVKDLNASTRWSCLPVSESRTAEGAMMATAWMTGVPLRSAFVNGRWEHDPWRYDSRRLFASGEADAAIYICCYGDPPPDWLPDIPALLLVNTSKKPLRRSAIRITIGQPGRDHDAVLYDRVTAGLMHQRASAPNGAPSVASILNRIRARLSA